MTPFATHRGIAAPMRIDNVDTDIIIPMSVLVSVPRPQLGHYAFQQIRYQADGAERGDFVLNQPQFRGASILIAGRNFGCGSSREWAVYALERLGIRVVVASSFGDIFLSNCIKNGLLPATLPEAEVLALMAEADAIAGSSRFEVDLTEECIRAPSGRTWRFGIDAALRSALLHGRDEIAATMDHDAAIRAFQARTREERPWLVPPGGPTRPVGS